MKEAVAAPAALAQEHRLAVFRLLLQAGPADAVAMSLDRAADTMLAASGADLTFATHPAARS